MNTKLPVNPLIGLVLLVGLFVASSSPIFAVSIAEQTQDWNNQLDVWQVIQELGNDLAGTIQDFTFRASTSVANNFQFDFTAENSKVYDKTTNTYILGCIPANSSPADRLRGLTFTTGGAPPGYQDVIIDFSCRNYSFISGHRYLILITNANMPRWGGMKMKLASVNYSGTSSDYFTGGGLRYAFDNNPCNAWSYIWNSQTANSGCNIFGNTKSDLYFILNNNAPPPAPPRLPVIFIPGIGGSELKASQDIIWSAPDGHDGTYSHGYSANEKIWVNQDEAASLGNDDYFDVLRLKTDGVTPEADLSLTGDLTSFGYSDIDSFFADMGYSKGTNYSVFPYDWRKDIRTTKDSLDALIETAKTASGQPQVNIVVHSMGGLVARYYISDAEKAAKVNKLIELGVPHLGATSALKTLMYGTALQKNVFGFIPLGIPASEIKDLAQNTPSIFQLIPSNRYFSFYDNSSSNYPFPFRDDRDIDNDKVTDVLNFDKIKSLLSNLSYNMAVFNIGEQLHSSFDTSLSQNSNTKIYEIVGTGQPTLGQISETWWINWPINMLSRTEDIVINGDGTIPLYSASLKSDALDISGAYKIYYVEQEHGDLVTNNGTAMQTLRAILNDDNSLPVEVKDEKIVLEGEQLSLDDGELDIYDDQNRHCGLNDNGEIEENIPDVTCTTSGNTKHAFVKKKAAKVRVKATRRNRATSSRTTNLKKRTYRQDRISKTIIYKDLNISQTAKIEFDLDPALDTSPSLIFYPDSSSPDNTTINPTSEISGSSATDQTPPTTSIQISGTKDSSGIYTGPVTITLTGEDSDSGILKIEYSLDNGQTVQTYTEPFIISTSGKTTIQIKAIDNLGNEEIPQSVIIEIAAQPTPTPTPDSSSGGSSSNSTSTTSGESTSVGTEPSGESFRLPSSGPPEVNMVNASPAVTRSGTTKQSSAPILGQPSILGLTFQNPNHISDQINVGGLLDQEKNALAKQKPFNRILENLGGLLLVSGGIITLASFGLLATFLKPIPK